MRALIKRHVPRPFLAAVARTLKPISRLLVYRQYDSSAYWRQRASARGEARVMWQNDEFNALYRRVQRELLREYVAPLAPGARVLDIGCGIGVVARMLADVNPAIEIDAVDFPEMIAAARQEYAAPNIRYIESSAEAYREEARQYDLILSSGCYSAIRDVPTMERALRNAFAMLAPHGVLMLIDPFHRWNYLARVKYSSRQVVRLAEQHGLRLQKRSGVLFWPMRERLANSTLTGDALAREFERGERWLRRLGPHLWADYKVLVFRRP